MTNAKTTVDPKETLNGNAPLQNDTFPMDSIAMTKSNGLTNGVVSHSEDYSSSSTVHRKSGVTRVR